LPRFVLQTLLLLVIFHRTFIHIALAFLLLLSQQLGISHAITHLSTGADAGSLQKKQLPVEKQCAQCLAFAAVDSGLASSSPAFIRPAGPEDGYAGMLFTGPLPAAILAFESRAPPVPA
jgi:hypothetical protein